MSVNINYVLLDVQRALLDAVVPSTRAVTVKINEQKKTFDFCFFYDEEVTDELFDLASTVPAEITIPLGYLVNDKIEYLNSLNPIPIHGELVYMRYEPTISPIIKKGNRKQRLQGIVTPEGRLLLDMQEALLAKVTPSLRAVHVYPDMDKKMLQFIFYYNGEISKLDVDLATSIINKGNWSFPGFEICHEITRLDHPNKIPWDGKMRAAYARCEEFPKP